MDRTVTDVLDFWFGSRDARRPEWFARDTAFDRLVARRFADLYYAAAEGKLDHWAGSADGALALVLLLDQFPRNIFRGDRRAFSTDGQARAIARRAIDRGFDKQMSPLRRQFFYLPFEHSEDRRDQVLAVELTRELPDATQAGSAHDWAVRHRDVIERFGRFPHRNAILGRGSTPEERAFLNQPGSSF